jgi:hypothetical protein
MKLNDLNLVIPDGPGGSPHTTIQSAIEAALTAPNSAVWIRADYIGEDTYTNPHNVQIFDNRVRGVVNTILQGLLADLPQLIVGQSYFATDVNILYIGTANGNSPTTALPLTGLAANTPPDAPAGMLYFATDTNQLYVALGQGVVLVVPPIHTGPLADIGVLVAGAFYLTTDTNSLYIGTTGGNVLVGPSPGSGLPPFIDCGTF